jgi:hypothetical protein
MLVRRLGAGALCSIALLTLVCARVSSDTGDKQLARVKGVVGYQESATSDFKPIFGRLDLPDDAFAVTKPNATAVLRLADSSEIDIGENTKVQVGAFNPASSGNVNTIVLNGGALHFNIRHPQGGQSNYRFVTATSQIAVRGTEGFLVAGANGTQVVCVSCAAGDVSVQVGQQTISVVSNQTLTVIGSNPLTASTSITANPTVNNPAVNQFNSNQNPFNPSPTSGGVDPTGSLSGAGTGAAGAGASSVFTTVGATAATAGVVASVVKTSASPSPAPAGPGTLVLQLNFPGATAFPYSFSWPFSQLNATGLATFFCSPSNVITCNTPTQAIGQGSNTAATNVSSTLNGVLTGMLVGPGTFTLSGSASGYTLPTTQFNVYSVVSLVTPPTTPISFTSVPSTQSVTVTQLPTGSQLSATISCPGGATAANVTLNGGTGPSPLTFSVTAHSAPTTQPPPAVACTILVNGQGDGAGASLSIPVNVTSTGIGISTNRRRPLESQNPGAR